MKIAIAGGCFTNQHNIPFERLYHQSILIELKKYFSELQIKTIRYERITKCLEKIVAFHVEYPFDLLIFHLRAEPLMRLTKLYYRYADEQRGIQHALNLPKLRILKPEVQDLLVLRPADFQCYNTLRESKLHHILREMNYITGSVIGNKTHAICLLQKMVQEIHAFCNDHQIQFLLLGPVSRPFSTFENKLSEEVDEQFKRLSEIHSIHYLSLIKLFTKQHQSMFFENGIHVSQEGHDEIAEMILDKCRNELMNPLSLQK
jgi:hypothetical protein